MAVTQRRSPVGWATQQMDTASLDAIVDGVIVANPLEWKRYREGDDKSPVSPRPGHESPPRVVRTASWSRKRLPPGAKPEVTLLAGSHRFADVARK